LPTIYCYVDADFAGTWTMANTSEASSVHSRTGYTIMFAACPILWTSKLQSEIALSTTEAEYMSLSQAMHDVIPLRTILEELNPIFNYPVQQIITHSTVFEDNKGCVDLIAALTLRPTHLTLRGSVGIQSIHDYSA